MEIVNCTPHAICLNDGTVFETSLNVARVSATFEERSVCPLPAGGCEDAMGKGLCQKECEDLPPLFSQKFGEITGLPQQRSGVLFIVSGIVLEAGKAFGRFDLIAPATGHADTIRNDKGHIVSVPGFVR